MNRFTPLRILPAYDGHDDKGLKDILKMSLPEQADVTMPEGLEQFLITNYSYRFFNLHSV